MNIRRPQNKEFLPTLVDDSPDGLINLVRELACIEVALEARHDRNPIEVDVGRVGCVRFQTGDGTGKAFAHGDELGQPDFELQCEWGVLDEVLVVLLLRS